MNKENSKYYKIYMDIKNKICRELYKVDQKLPSIRLLMDNFSVSRNTVVLAYEQLQVEGFIRSEEKKGFFVEKIDPFLVEKEFLDDEPEVSMSNNIIDLNQSAVDEEYFPKDTWRRMMVRAIDQLEIQYGYWKGDIELRRELRKYLYLSRGVNAGVEQIIIGAGTNILLNFICLALDFKNVGFEDPGYFGARKVFENHNRNLIPIDMTKSGIDVEELNNSKADLVYVTPSHQYPTGIITPISERQKLIKWAKRTSSYIIEDDYDSEYRFKGSPIPSMQSLDKDERVIYISTFSKAFLPSMRMAYMIVPRHLLETFEEFGAWEQTIPFVDQRAMYHFIKDGYWEKHHRRMRKLYREKHKVVLECFNRVFGDSVRLITQETGLRVLVEFKSYVKEEEFIKSAFDAGYAIRGTNACWINKPKGRIVQLLFGYGLLKKEDIGQTVEALHICWKNFL